MAARQISDNPPTYILVWFDLESGEHLDLVMDIPYLLDFAIAPDGQQVAYIVGDPASLGHIGNSYYTPFKGTIYLQDITLAYPPQPVGSCTNVTMEEEEKGWPGCFGLLWSPDSQQLVWADARGIWDYWPDLATTSLLQSNRYHIDGEFDLNVFRLIDWSPSGRYLRLDVGHFEGLSESILDLQSGQLIEIPYTFAYEGPVITSVSWMQDDRLFMVRTTGGYGNFVNYAEFWRVQPEQGELVLEQSLHIPTGPDAYASEATQLADGSLAFAVFSFEEGDKTAGLYRLTPQQGVLQKTNQLPPQIDYDGTVFWTSDGDGAIIVWYRDPQSLHFAGTRYDFVFVQPHDAHFYYVRPLLGSSISSDDKGHLPIVWGD